MIQILKSVHRTTVSKYIRDQLDDLDGLLLDDGEVPRDLEQLTNVVVGAKRPPVTFENLEQEFAKDSAFQRFRVRFSDYISDFLQHYNYGLPNGRRIKYTAGDKASFPVNSSQNVTSHRE